jgi:ABC-type bacteriocin/lantibiotic exporter with double-glycine peptidase domain
VGIVLRLLVLYVSIKTFDATPGKVLMAYLLMNLFIKYSGPFVSIFSSYNDFKRSKDFLSEILSSKLDARLAYDHSKQQLLPTIIESIRVCDLSYRYPGSNVAALNHVSFQLPDKGIVVIAGKSGCGKSTLARIISGRQNLDSGAVFINDVKLHEIDHFLIGHKISFENQDMGFMSGTILDNITYKYDIYDELLLEAVCNLSNCFEFILSMPGKFSFKLSEGGKGLSTGQKQRLCLARALYAKPLMIVLDETISHLDDKNQELILDALKQISYKNLLVLVSHETAIIERADCLVLLKQGRLHYTGAPTIEGLAKYRECLI